jgi:hypothetical protein
MGDESDETTKKEEFVITPGGPRPKDRVHSVGPGEAVYVDESGNARVIPLEQEGGTVNMAEDMVLTPGGFRLRSLVHVIEPDHILDGTGDRLRKLDPSGKAVADFGQIPFRTGNAPLMPGNVAVLAEEVVALGSGWIVYASWSNNTGNSISSFSTTWKVPPAPVTQSGQTIFLFNGIQNSSMIYQPVLQWGPSAAGGGNFWAVASWYADGQGGQAFVSELTQVNPGDTLVGVMTLTGQSGNMFNYNCEFQGIANSGLRILNQPQLTWAVETLEAYGITQCSDYPNTDHTAMRGINVQPGGLTPALNWTAVNSITDCGQHCVVVSNSPTEGEVDIYYSSVLSINPTRSTIFANVQNNCNPFSSRNPADNTRHFTSNTSPSDGPQWSVSPAGAANIRFPNNTQTDVVFTRDPAEVDPTATEWTVTVTRTRDGRAASARVVYDIEPPCRGV